MSERNWKLWFKKAGIRALKTVAQVLVGQIPVGIIVTPVMIQQADWSFLYVILAWLATGLLSGLGSMLTSLAGIPEEHIDEPEVEQ